MNRNDKGQIYYTIRNQFILNLKKIYTKIQSIPNTCSSSAFTFYIRFVECLFGARTENRLLRQY